MHCKKLSAAPFANHQYKAKRPLRAAASPKCNQVSESGGCDCSEAVLLPVYAKKPRPRKPAISIVQAWNTHDCPDQTAPRCYSQRGTCEQWIEEGKGAIKWTRLSCWTFASNAVRLQLHALAYNLGNFLRTLATPEPIKDWSLTSLKEKLIKIGAKVVSHGRYIAFQMAEVAIPRQMFQEILRLIAELRPQPPPTPV